MAGYRIEDLIEGKVVLNGTTYDLEEIKTTQGVIWSGGAETYSFSNVRIAYTNGVNYILANGSNYGTIYATVTTYRGSTIISVVDNVALDAVKRSGSLSVQNGKVVGSNRGTTEGSALSGVFRGVYNGFYTSNITATQEANAVVSSAVQNIVVESLPSSLSVAASGATVQLGGRITRTVVNTYTSGSTLSTTDNVGAMAVYVNNSYQGDITTGQTLAYAIGSNKSLFARAFTAEVRHTYDGTLYTDDAQITQSAGYYTYSAATIIASALTDVPASGGAVYPDGYVYQTYGWNGNDSELGEVGDTPSVSWSISSFTGSHLGTTVTARTLLGTTVGSAPDSHGKSISPVALECYQQANVKSVISQSPVITMTMEDMSDVPAIGDRRNVKATSVTDTLYGYTSGSQQHTDTPLVRLASVSVGKFLEQAVGEDTVSVSGRDVPLTWQIPQNTEGGQRLCRAYMEGRLYPKTMFIELTQLG